MSNNHENCLRKVLKVIDILQQRAEEKEERFEGCDRPFLGRNIENRICFNTRPVMLFMKNGNELKVDMEHGEETVFRVEKVFDNCVKLRVLKENKKTKEKHHRFKETKEFITVNICCIGAIKCLDDVILENL